MWSISRPGKNGAPSLDLSDDENLPGVFGDRTATQCAHERVIMKVFRQYSIPLAITDSIRSVFKGKLCRMGKQLSTMGGKKRSQQLASWKDSAWNFRVNAVAVNQQLLRRKQALEEKLDNESSKRIKLEKEVKELKKKSTDQVKLLSKLRSGRVSDKGRYAIYACIRYACARVPTVIWKHNTVYSAGSGEAE